MESYTILSPQSPNRLTSRSLITLSVDVVTNDLYNIGVNDDQLNLIYECDSLSKVAVKTVDDIAESQVENLQRLQFGPQKCLKLHVGRKWKST